MSLPAYPRNNVSNTLRQPLAKSVILFVISLALFWFSEEFAPAAIFEPRSSGWVLWVSYAKDLIQPFAFYFFLCLGERWLKTWSTRALFAFAIPALLEFGQYLYYRVSTGHYVGSFDPMDIVMYGTGVGLAVVAERKVFAGMLNFGNNYESDFTRQEDPVNAQDFLPR